MRYKAKDAVTGEVYDRQAVHLELCLDTETGEAKQYLDGIEDTVEPIDIFTTNNESVTVNGKPTEVFKSTYYGAELDSINMSFDIVDDQGALQTQLDSTALGYPPLLLPILKGDGGETIYFTTTLALGVATVTGKFKDSSDWKLLTARVNEALAVIGADWMLEKEDVTFMINA